jgi:hypothetical protein
MSKARQLADLGGDTANLEDISSVLSSGQLSNRNLIINGAMQVAQRGTSASSVTSGGYYASDRFQAAMSSLGTWTISRETDAPSGFKYSHKYLCTVADASPGVNDYINCNYPFETQDVRLLNYGFSNAKKATLSFWVKSNKTGNASVGCFHYTGSTNYFYSQQYTINTADTWEYKTVTINPNTTGGFRTEDTLQGFTVEWFLNGGSSKTGGSHDSWSTSQTNRNVSNLGLGGAVNDYWQITGVQLEVGDTATPFEHRSYGQELALCQRYFQTGGNCGGRAYSTQAMQAYYQFPVQMRATPTITKRGAGNAINMDTGKVHIAGVNNYDISTVVGSDPHLSGVLFTVTTTTASMVSGAAAGLRGNPANMDAEL